ncbi:MAG: site-specific integrase, partial [Bryobacterales bacterium]|nr:site-specific integrase [Bryobacterales bacterium]
RANMFYRIAIHMSDPAMALAKQAKILTAAQQSAMLNFLKDTRHPVRNAAIFLLSTKAGLRAKEIAHLTWAMVTDAEGQLTDGMRLENVASKGKTGGREIPLNRELKAALLALAKEQSNLTGFVIRSERGPRTSAAVIANTLADWYDRMGLAGCSSHSGRRTFITTAAKKLSMAGGSLRDIQELAGHASLATTQRYIAGDSEAKRKLMQLI